jgi:hypothetical protein
VHAQDADDDHPGLVEVEEEPSIIAVTSEGAPLRVPYRERRSDFSINFGVANRSLELSAFRSKIDEQTYKDVLNSNPVNQTELTMGMKYNFVLGSLGADLGYGIGSVGYTSDDALVDRNLDLKYTSASTTLALDSLFDEPYVVPYLRAGLYTVDFTETDGLTSTSQSGTTAPALFYSIGALIQLNWVEPVVAYESYREFGLENAFLDFSITQYSASDTSSDPKLGTDPAFGFGLRLEF